MSFSTLDEIKSFPYVARQLARQTNPKVVVERSIEDLLDIAIRARKRHGAGREDPGGHHQFATDMLEEVKTTLSSCFELIFRLPGYRCLSIDLDNEGTRS